MTIVKNPVELYRAVAKFGDGSVWRGRVFFSDEKKAVGLARGTAQRLAPERKDFTSYGVEVWVAEKGDLIRSLPGDVVTWTLRNPFVDDDGVVLYKVL